MVTRVSKARRDPELAVLSVLAHGQGPHAVAVGRAALAAVRRLDSARRPLYIDLVQSFLGAAARAALGEAMENLSDDEILRSDFAHRIRLLYFGRDMAARRKALREATEEGRREGRQEGEVDGELEGLREGLHALLAARSIALTATQRRTIAGCRQRDQLLTWIQRAATISAGRELFAAARGPRRPVASR